MQRGQSKVRLDQLLVERNFARSRENAKAMIMAGVVEVEGFRVDKPGRLVPVDVRLSIKEKYPPYVSRGGLKLEAAIKEFHVPVAEHTFMDVGASTGGFTDCLLRYGAKKVIAIDVGYGQLDWGLRNDQRVEVWERTNIRYLKKKDLMDEVSGAVIDVSFISLKLVLPVVSEILTPRALVIALVKPQFEVGREQVGKGGVVRDPIARENAVREIAKYSETLGWKVAGILPSPILGPKGNQEYLLYLTREEYSASRP